MKRVLLLLAVTISGGCMFPEEDPEDMLQPPPLPDVCGDGERTGTEVCDDGNLLDGDACSSACGRVEAYQIHWQTSTLAGDVRTCPAGVDLAEVILQPVAPFTALPDGPEIVRAVDCTDGIAEVVVKPHPYLVSVRMSTAATGETYGQTLPVSATSGQRLTLYTDAGYARVTWNLRRETGTALDCQAALVDDIFATFTPAGGGAPITTSFDCAKATATTTPLAAGTYDLILSARQHTSASTRLTIAPRSALTDLGPIAITIPSGT